MDERVLQIMVVVILFVTEGGLFIICSIVQYDSRVLRLTIVSLGEFPFLLLKGKDHLNPFLVTYVRARNENDPF